MQQDKDMCITTVYCKTIFAVVKMLQKIGEKLNETWCWPVQESYETWDSILHNIVDQINCVVFNRMKHFLVLVGIGLQTPREIIWFFFHCTYQTCVVTVFDEAQLLLVLTEI